MKIRFQKEEIEGILGDMCDEYNKEQKQFESIQDKIYRVLLIIAICELSNLYENRCDGGK